MRSSEKVLATILSHSIRNQPVSIVDEFELDEVMNEAQSHDVSGLVYRVLKSQLDLSAYKNEMILRSLTQSQYTHQALQVIQELQQEGIQVILLKGIVLKSFYPVADLRTMGDVDVLVSPSQLEKVDELLSRRGYEKKSILNEKHHVYEGPGFQIEVHWTLGSLKRQQGLLTFEEHLWRHLQPIEINQKTYWTLSDEDFLIHLILHAAGHMRSAGFGIRQLCDLTLWVEQHPNLDGLYIETQLELLKLTRFSVYLLQICHRLLDLKLSERWLHEAIEESAIQTFMSAIFSNGVHGKREAQQQFGNCLAYETAKVSAMGVRLRFLFPSLKSLSAYYTYAHRYPLLLPIAWIHRLARTWLRSDYTCVQKIATFFHSPRLAKKQSTLLVALGLVDEV